MCDIKSASPNNQKVESNKMFQINAHVLPKEGSEHNENIIGAYASVYISYIDIDGTFELAKYYLTQNGWEIKELEEDYFIIESEDDVEEEQKQLYREALKDGYSLLLFGYSTEVPNE